MEDSTDLAAVLSDLRKKRSRLDAAIRAIETLLAGDASAVDSTDQISNSPFELVELTQNHLVNETREVRRRGPFDGISILSATRKILSEAKEPRTATEIAALLVSGGYLAKSRNFGNTVAAVLNRCDKTGGDVIRVGKNLFTLVERNQALPSSIRSTPNE
jgi:hypothetical protein